MAHRKSPEGKGNCQARPDMVQYGYQPKGALRRRNGKRSDDGYSDSPDPDDRSLRAAPPSWDRGPYRIFSRACRTAATLICWWASDTNDDACVYRITDKIAAIHTVDFFTPIVDDPFWFGQIAAANALSDVYAMGGRPAVAMNLLCVPCSLPQEVIRRIWRADTRRRWRRAASLPGATRFKITSRNTASASPGMSIQTGCCGTWARSRGRADSYKAHRHRRG